MKGACSLGRFCLSRHSRFGVRRLAAAFVEVRMMPGQWRQEILTSTRLHGKSRCAQACKPSQNKHAMESPAELTCNARFPFGRKVMIESENSFDDQARSRRVLLVTGVGAAVNVALSVLKLAVGWLFSVQSVFADGIHSFSDLISDAILVVFVRISARPRSRNRPFGYRKWETLATLAITLLLMCVAVLMVWSSLTRRAAPEHPFGFWPLLVTVVSIVAKESLFWYTAIEGRRIRSPAMVANAWHHRSDALSSVVVLFCLLMAMFFGHAALWDKLGVGLVAVMIIKAAWDIGRSAFGDLLDYAPKPEIVNKVEELADADPDVRLVRDMRIRTVSEAYHVSLCIEVDGKMTVAEGHDVAERVEKAIRAGVPGTFSVMVHVEPAGHLVSRIAKEGLENIADEELL